MKLFGLVVLALCGSLAVAQQEPDPDDEQYALDNAEQINFNDRDTKYPDGVNTIPGEAELNYPVYNSIMKTSFSCVGRPAGFYADLEARCQVWHICDVDERMTSYLCTNGTIFSQTTRVCEWWYNTNCDANEVEKEYEHNRELYQVKDLDKLREANRETQERSKSHQRENPEEERYRPAPQQQPRRESYNEPQQQPRRENYNEPQQQPRQQQQRPPQPPRPQDIYPEKALTLSLQQKFKVSSDSKGSDFSAPNNAFRPETQQQQQRQAPPQQQPRPTPQQQNGQYREEPVQRPTQPPQQLSREELEARRLAARDEFYSTAARKQQENRINQVPPSPAPRQYVAESRNDNQAVEQRRPTKEYSPEQGRPRNDEQAPPKKKPVNPEYIPGAPPLVIKPKFRHSTPRKHNVHFTASAQRSQSQFDDERQIPEESQQKGFPFYNPRQFQEYNAALRQQQPEAPTARRVPATEPTTERQLSYLPTSRTILREAPTHQPEVDLTKRRRRRKDPKRIAAIRAERERLATSTTPESIVYEERPRQKPTTTAKPFVFEERPRQKPTTTPKPFVFEERPRQKPTTTPKPFVFEERPKPRPVVAPKPIAFEPRPKPRPVPTTTEPPPITTTQRRYQLIPKVTVIEELPQVTRGESINRNPKYNTFPLIPRNTDVRVKSESGPPPVKTFNANLLSNEEDPRLVVRPKNASGARVVVKRKLRNKTLSSDHRRAFVQNNDVISPATESVEQQKQKLAVESRVQNDFTQIHAPVKRCAVAGEGNSFKILC